MRHADEDIALILFDLDGTLLDRARSIHPATIEAIAAVIAAGVRVGLATGRGPRSAQPYARGIGATGPLVLFNGALIWDMDENRPIHQHHLPRADALHAVAIARAHGAHINGYVGDEIWISQVTECSRRSERKDGVPHRVVGDIAEAVRAADADIVKLLLIDERRAVMDMAAPIRAGLHTACSLVNSEPSYLEVLPPGVTKGAALADIERIYGIEPRRVLAFGDQRNDIELMRAAGVGVAMGNAVPEVKQVADVVIGDNDSDAIAAFLRARFTRSPG